MCRNFKACLLIFLFLTNAATHVSSTTTGSKDATTATTKAVATTSSTTTTKTSTTTTIGSKNTSIKSGSTTTKAVSATTKPVSTTTKPVSTTTKSVSAKTKSGSVTVTMTSGTTTSTKAETDPPPQTNQRYADFVDYTFSFNIGGSNVRGLETFLIAIAKHFPIGNESRATVCVKFFKMSGQTMDFNLPKNANDSMAKEIIKKVIEGIESPENSCMSRIDAHKGPVDLHVFQPTTTWDDEVSPHVLTTRVKEKKLAVVAVNSFDAPVDSSNKVKAVAAVVGDNIQQQPKNWDSASFSAIADDLAQHLAKRFQAAFKECVYHGFNSSCSYVEGPKCVYKELLVRQNLTSTLGILMPGLCSPAVMSIPNRTCNVAKCEQVCDQELSKQPCQTECGPGSRNLPLTGDYRFCPPRSVPCTGKSCPTTTTSSASSPIVSKAAVIGQTFMVVGGLMFGLSGIGLVVLRCIAGADAKGPWAKAPKSKIKSPTAKPKDGDSTVKSCRSKKATKGKK